MRIILVATVAAFLAACAVGPDYRTPETPATPFIAAQGAGVAEQPFEAAWWEQFQDPVLDGLIERALTDDLDLKIAVARVEESRAFLGAARRDRWPGVVAEVSRTESKQQQPLFTTDRIDTESYNAGLATLWELDLFGRVRRGVEAAGAEADAALADLRDAQVLIAAEVARNYIELRGAQKRLGVARQNLGYQQDTLDLTRVRLELGRGSELDVASAAARLVATEATIPPLVAAEAAAANRLAVLLGERPGALADVLVYREVAPHLT
ncbi:MAG TPA: TolC family protein, partial [Gammaproteobacteria bacterium]